MCSKGVLVLPQLRLPTNLGHRLQPMPTRGATADATESQLLPGLAEAPWREVPWTPWIHFRAFLVGYFALAVTQLEPYLIET